MKRAIIPYNRKYCTLWLALGIVLLLVTTSSAQVRVPYRVRTSVYSPDQKVYSLHGDFSFIGNTNLTLLNYEPQTNNNNSLMRYVDVDNDTSTWNSSSADLVYSTENNALPACSRIVYAGLYWTGKSAPDNSIDSSNEFSVIKNIDGQTVSKTFNKRKIRLKGPGASNYTEFIAKEDAIYYPNVSDAYIYSAYTEVTDYVRQNGSGTYFAADIALVEGNGGGTGYSGGWGMVVIYENPQLKHRDISVFDGHAFVLNSNSNGYLLEINGFHTVQTGNVGAKLGVMASEGDIALDGDYLQMQKNSDLSFIALQHSQNTANNFFNSSINNGNSPRNPNLENNTGIDLAMFDLSNPGNSVIGNNQTLARFKYGTNSDTYAIFALVLAVDSYVPQTENEITVTQINQTPAGIPYTTLPGDEIRLKVTLKNTENEPITNYKLIVPLPYNTEYIPSSAVGNLLYNAPTSAATSYGFDPSLGPNGAVFWNYGTLPVAQSLETALATFEFKLRVTQNCSLLKQPDCASEIRVAGYAEGTGAVSGIPMPPTAFVLGHYPSGACLGNPIRGSLKIKIDAADYLNNHCQSTTAVRNFTFCGSENYVAFEELLTQFPAGTFFYNAYPLDQNTLQYSALLPFALTPGTTTTYYAIKQNPEGACVMPFTLTKCTEISANQDQGLVINSQSGGITIENVLNNDFLNGHIASATEVTISQISTSHPGISLSGTQVIVATGTPAGNYLLTYQICATNNPDKCSTATVIIPVSTTQLIAANDNYHQACSVGGLLGNILENDTLNGNPVLPAQVIISLEYPSDPKISIDTQTGKISVAEGLTQGHYGIQYKISSVQNPSNFDLANISIDITDQNPPAIPLLNDIVQFCEAQVNVPTASDDCAGLICAVTTDPLHYDVPGHYIVHWSFVDPSGNAATAQQNVTIKSSQQTEPGYGYVDCNLDNDFSLNIDLNSYLPEGMSAQGSWTSESLTPNLSGSLFSPYLAPTGNYNFKYHYSKDNCVQNVEVNIEVNNDCLVEPACNLMIHNAFSPNNDGVNDTFIIGNIDQTYCFPTNTVEIYNRWGVLVYKTQQYDNNTRVFKGYCEGRATLSESEQLPAGTYFYVIQYTDEKGEHFEQDGYLYLGL